MSKGCTVTSSPPIRPASSEISIEAPAVTEHPLIVGPDRFFISAVASRRPTSCLKRG